MAIGANKHAKIVESGMSKAVVVSPTTDWVDIIDAGGMDDVTTSAAVKPEGFADSDHHRFVSLGGEITNIMLRMAYDPATTDDGTSPVVYAYGRTVQNDGSSAGPYMALYNQEDTAVKAITLSQDGSADAQDASFKYTDVKKHQTLDAKGCNQVIVGVGTAFAGSDGNEALAKLQIKGM